MTGFWFDRQGQPIDAAKASELLGDPDYKVVARHAEAGYLVSTVWLGMDLGFDPGAPLLFETMIFGPEGYGDEQYCERYPTEAAALAGHDQAVAALRTEILGGAE